MDYHAGEVQMRVLNSRMDLREKHLSELCRSLSTYARKLAGVRDAADQLADCLLRFGQSEAPGTTLQAALLTLAQHLAVVQDHREAQIRRLETKTVKKIAEYGAIVKQTRDELRKGSDARTREMNRRQQLDRMQTPYPTNWNRTVVGSCSTVARVYGPEGGIPLSPEATMESFEERRTEDLQQVMLDFVNVQLLFHARALEQFSGVVQSVALIDKEHDLEVLRGCLRAPTLHQRAFRSTPNLSSGSPEFTRASTIPGRRSVSASRRSSSSARVESDEELTESEDDDGPSPSQFSRRNSVRHRSLPASYG